MWHMLPLQEMIQLGAEDIDPDDSHPHSDVLLAVCSTPGFRNLMRLGDSRIKPGQTARHELWGSRSGTTGVEDEHDITLPELGEAREGCIMRTYVGYRRGSLMCWNGALLEKIFERRVYKKCTSICPAK